MIEESIANSTQTSELLLDSLEITNFRAFPHLRIEQLGRVNLIVGQNSVGKTSLLEALWLYANRGSPVIIRSLLENRDEYNVRRRVTPSQSLNSFSTLTTSFKYLFYGRQLANDVPTQIEIGPINKPKKRFLLRFGWYIMEEIAEGGFQIQPVGGEQLNLANDPFRALEVGLNNLFEFVRLDQPSRIVERFENPSIINNYISSNGLDGDEQSRLWRQIALTDLEEDVVKALRLVSEQVERVTIVEDPTRTRSRSPIVRYKGIKEPLPLRSLGDGINRIFGIILALVNSKDGILLVDEIENGLYHGVQYELWKLILEVASRLNVQVFATTHSWDCIEAFQAATHENQQESGMVVRLENKDGQIVPVTYDERRLAIATRAQIEVR